MDKLSTPVGPSAQVPLLEGTRLEFAKAFKAQASSWALLSLLPGLIRELRNVPYFRDIKLEGTTRLLSSVGGPTVPGDVGDIFMSIPSDALESLVLGTMAFDNNRPQNRVAGLNGDGPGIYVLGISIINRAGEFLDADELKVLITNMKRYLRAYDTVQGANGDSAQAATDFLAKIDNTYGKSSTPGVARFVTSDGNAKATRFLIASLQRRYDALCAVDPSRTVRTLQSPLYVGCGKSVRARAIEYELAHYKSSLDKVNKFFGLTACLLHYQGLHPKVHIVTVVRTWTEGQVAKAEMLVAALAGSYITQDGFNLRETGGNTEPAPAASWSTHEQYVFADVQYLEYNVMRSIEDIDRLQKLRECDTALNRVVTNLSDLHSERVQWRYVT